MIGQLDQRITFRRATEASDGYGGKTVTWANLTTEPTVWARIIPQRQGEDLQNDRMTATGIIVVRIRNRQDLTEKDAFVWNGVTYNIRGFMLRSPREQYLDFEAERGVVP